MKKTPSRLIAALSLLTLLTTSCQTPLDKVIFTQLEPPVTASIALDYAGLVTLIESEATFLLTITNSRCTCTTEFMPHYDRFISEQNIAGYTLEYTEVLYEPVKYGLPVVDSNSPILTIYQTGLLKYDLAYKIGDSKFNLPFTNYDALAQYLLDRIDVS